MNVLGMRLLWIECGLFWDNIAFFFLCGFPDTLRPSHQPDGGSSHGTSRVREPGEIEENNFHTPSLKLHY